MTKRFAFGLASVRKWMSIRAEMCLVVSFWMQLLGTLREWSLCGAMRIGWKPQIELFGESFSTLMSQKHYLRRHSDRVSMCLCGYLIGKNADKAK